MCPGQIDRRALVKALITTPWASCCGRSLPPFGMICYATSFLLAILGCCGYNLLVLPLSWFSTSGTYSFSG